MLNNYVTLNVILIFIVVGVIFGFIYDALKLIKIIFKNNLLVVNILDFFAVMFGGIIFIITIFRYNFGEFSLFEVLLFIFGLVFEQIIVENLFTSPFKWVYNEFNLRKSKKDFPLINNKI